jgi:hypothetical protein
MLRITTKKGIVLSNERFNFQGAKGTSLVFGELTHHLQIDLCKFAWMILGNDCSSELEGLMEALNSAIHVASIA